MIATDEIAKMQYEDLRQEERDRMNARLQFWQLYYGLVSVFCVAFGVAGLRIGAYLLAMLPVLLAFLARYIGHSEAVLKQIRKYLYSVEKQAEYDGYESYVRKMPRLSHGGYLSALRDAMLLTDALAFLVVLWRLAVDNWYMLVGLVVLVAVGVFVITCRWLNGK